MDVCVYVWVGGEGVRKITYGRYVCVLRGGDREGVEGGEGGYLVDFTHSKSPNNSRIAIDTYLVVC